MKLGYARVSTIDQDTASQIAQLEREGCERMYTELPMSAMKTSRPELDKMIAEMTAGDIVTVCRLDRLGRSLQHLIGLVQMFNARGVGFKSLSEQIDTTSPQGKLIFHVMGAMGEFERDLIAQRTSATLQHLKRQGIKLGPPVKDRTEEIRQLRDGLQLHETPDQIIKRLGWSRSRYFTVLKLMEEKSVRGVRKRREDNGRFEIEHIAGRKGGWPRTKAN